MRRRIKNILLFATVALALFGSVWLLTKVISLWTNHEFWFQSIGAGIGFLFTAAIVYFAVQHLLPRPYLKKSVVAITIFYVLVGVMDFFVPDSFIHPASAKLFDANGQTTQGVCSICGSVFPRNQKFCPFHGTALVFGNRETVEEAGIDVDGSPFQRLMHMPGEEKLFVSANRLETSLPLKLSKGQKIRIQANGTAKDGYYNLESGPDGKNEFPFLDRSRRYQCGGSYLALCVKVGSQAWQYCGSECTVASIEDKEVFVHLSVNEGVADQNGSYHQEWWNDNSGGFDITYITMN